MTYCDRTLCIFVVGWTPSANTYVSLDSIALKVPTIPKVVFTTEQYKELGDAALSATAAWAMTLGPQAVLSIAVVGDVESTTFVKP